MIETGDIILVSSNTIKGLAIQKFQEVADKKAGQQNHAGIILIEEDIVYVIEALSKGIQKTNFEENYGSGKNGRFIILKPLFDTTKFDYIRTFNKYVNKSKYDWINTLFFQPIRILFSIWLGPKKENNKFECAEFVYFICKQVSPALFFRNPEEIAPYNLFLNNNFFHLQINQK